MSLTEEQKAIIDVIAYFKDDDTSLEAAMANTIIHKAEREKELLEELDNLRAGITELAQSVRTNVSVEEWKSLMGDFFPAGYYVDGIARYQCKHCRLTTSEPSIHRCQ